MGSRLRLARGGAHAATHAATPGHICPQVETGPCPHHIFTLRAAGSGPHEALPPELRGALRLPGASGRAAPAAVRLRPVHCAVPLPAGRRAQCAVQRMTSPLFLSTVSLPRNTPAPTRPVQSRVWRRC